MNVAFPLANGSYDVPDRLTGEQALKVNQLIFLTDLASIKPSYPDFFQETLREAAKKKFIH